MRKYFQKDKNINFQADIFKPQGITAHAEKFIFGPLSKHATRL